MRYILIILMIAVYAIFGIPTWLEMGESPYLARALAYSFFHASLWHLAVNSLATWTLYRNASFCKACKELLVAFLIAVAVYPLSFRPVIGFSNVLYATIGMRTPPLSSPWWRKSPVIVFLAVTVAMFFIPRFSATTHVAAFALGIGYAYLRRFHKSIMNDAGRYL